MNRLSSRVFYLIYVDLRFRNSLLVFIHIVEASISNLSLIFNGSLADERRVLALTEGELSFGEFGSETVSCRILDLSDTGVLVETDSLVQVPEFLSLRFFLNIELRVRLCWTAGNQIGLEFLSDETSQDPSSVS
jgi:hypothetical protein